MHRDIHLLTNKSSDKIYFLALKQRRSEREKEDDKNESKNRSFNIEIDMGRRRRKSGKRRKEAWRREGLRNIRSAPEAQEKTTGWKANPLPETTKRGIG